MIESTEVIVTHTREVDTEDPVPNLMNESIIFINLAERKEIREVQVDQGKDNFIEEQVKKQKNRLEKKWNKR